MSADKYLFTGTSRDICRKAINRFGRESQVNKAIEEMAELTVAIEHYGISRATKDDVVEEIADVMIMMQQLAMMIGEDSVNLKIKEKLERLDKRLRNEAWEEHYEETKRLLGWSYKELC